MDAQLTEPIAATPVTRAKLLSADAVFAVLTIASIIPALLVRYPQCVDYLNHLARLHVLGAPADAAIHRFYEVRLHLLTPNLALDGVYLWVRSIASPELVMKAAWMGSVLALGGSIWFLHRSFHETTRPTLPLCAACLLNFPITAGFLNYSLGVPLVFLGLGIWVRGGSKRSWRTLVLLNLLGGIGFFVHIAALAAMGLTLLLYHTCQPPLRLTRIARGAVELLPAFVVPAILAGVSLLFATPSHSDYLGAYRHISQFLSTKPLTVLGPVFTGRATADLATLCALMGAAVVFRFQGQPQLRVVIGAWVALLVLMPGSIGAVAAVDIRLSVIPFILYFASVNVRPSPRTGVILAAVASVLVVSRLVTLVPQWQQYNADVQSLRDVESRVGPGARVLVSLGHPQQDNCQYDGWPPFQDHLPTLLAIDRGDFVSTLFAADNMQPIHLTRAARDITSPDGETLPWWVLDRVGTKEGRESLVSQFGPALYRRLIAPYSNWRHDYDYLAVRHLGCAPELPPDKDLALVAQSRTYRIYRIDHS